MSERNEATADTIPVSEAASQVLIMVERIAMVYYHFAQTLVNHLGEEKARELVTEAIASYGKEVGERQRERILAAGLEAECENYRAVPDLARLAWTPDYMPRLLINGEERPVCPLAKYWIDKGAADIGRLYCYVDQAKYAAFDPECECRHPRNVLDGDSECLIVAKKKSEWATTDGGEP